MTADVQVRPIDEGTYAILRQQAKPPSRQRLSALRRLSARQDRAAAHGRQFTLSRAQLARELGFSRVCMERIDLTCRLRLLQALARQAPQVLAEMGASAHQISFLSAMRISPGQARRLWQRWGRLGEE